MHGCRLCEKTSKWPDLIFTIDAAYGNGYLDFQTVNELLLPKRTRLLLAMAGGCNAYREADNTLPEGENEEDINDEDKQICYLPSPSHNKMILKIIFIMELLNKMK